MFFLRAVAPESQPPVVDGGLASYCTGSLPRMVLNGTEAYPAVHGKNLPLSCCFSNQLEIISATVGFPLTVTWQTIAGGLTSTTPVDLDLANLPAGSSHPFIHTMDLYAPHVVATY